MPPSQSTASQESSLLLPGDIAHVWRQASEITEPAASSDDPFYKSICHLCSGFLNAHSQHRKSCSGWRWEHSHSVTLLMSVSFPLQAQIIEGIFIKNWD